MNCRETQELKHAYADGELDLLRSVEIEQHLNGCGACSHAYQNVSELSGALKTTGLYFTAPADLKVFALHHHLIPVPGTGRERSVVNDAGDLLEVLIDSSVNIVLSGHKHVPYVWRLENIYLCNAGTVASLRVRGYTKPCYNVLEFEGDEVKISRKFPFGGQTTIAHFSLSTGVQYFRELEVLIQEPLATHDR